MEKFIIGEDLYRYKGKEIYKLNRIYISDKFAMVPLQGLIAFIDLQDVDKVQDYNWYPAFNEHTHYAIAHLDDSDKMIKMHRLILDAPDDCQVDHIDRNGLNNMRNNLRLGYAKLNANNRRPRGMTIKRRNKYLIS